jgi:hypothetical protein
VNARIRNKRSWNIGSAIRFSTTQKITSTTAPPISVASTNGLVHPIVCPP